MSITITVNLCVSGLNETTSLDNERDGLEWSIKKSVLVR